MIFAALIGAVIAGVIPLVTGIILLATGKIKATSFWAGVLAFVIAILASGIITIILAAPSVFGSLSDPSAAELSDGMNILITVLSSLILGLSLLILIKSCMKARTFKAAVSAGLGYGIPFILTTGYSFVSMYSSFSQINTGAFDKMYELYVSQGMMSKDMAKEMAATAKAMFLEMTVSDIVATTVVGFANAFIMVAAAVVIMLYVCKKKAFIGMLLATGFITVESIISILIPNVLVSAIVVFAISVAAFLYAYRVRDGIAVPEQPVVQDNFMNSINNAKEE